MMDNKTMMNPSVTMAKNEDAVVEAFDVSVNCSLQGRRCQHGSRLSSRRIRLGTSAECDGERSTARNVPH